MGRKTATQSINEHLNGSSWFFGVRATTNVSPDLPMEREIFLGDRMSYLAQYAPPLQLQMAELYRFCFLRRFFMIIFARICSNARINTALALFSVSFFILTDYLFLPHVK